MNKIIFYYSNFCNYAHITLVEIISVYAVGF
jgi:hypothetical protein